MKKRIAFLLAAILLFTSVPWSAMQVKAAPAEKSPADGCKILEYVDEGAFEKADHLGRMPEEETLSNYVFLNKDGTRTAYYLDEAVKFVDTDGKIKEKDITLTSVLGGYATTQNDVTVTLPVTMSSGVNLSYNNYQISLIPEGGTASAPRIVNNAAEYVDFYGTDTVLKYTPTLSGVKEDIILESYTGQNTFTFILNTNGLAVYHTKEDRYYLAPGKGTDPVYWLGALEIYDAALNMGTGTMTVEPMMAGQKYKITITVDTNWLTSANTVYPVTVDPSVDTVISSYAEHGTGYIDDAPIYSGKPNSNFGSYIYNRIGYLDSNYGEGRTVVRLVDLMADSTYKNLTATSITSAVFYIYDASGSAASTVDVRAITQTPTWKESSVTWNNSGTTFSTSFGVATAGYGNCFAIDITTLIQKWKVGIFGGSHCFVLQASPITSSSRALYSSEHSTTAKRPYVVISYNSAPMYSSYNSAGYFRNTYYETDSLGDHDYGTDGLQLRSNCYGYVLRLYCSEDGYMQYPGEFANKAGGIVISVEVGDDTTDTVLSDYGDVISFISRQINNPSRSDEFRARCMYELVRIDAGRDKLNFATEYRGTTVSSTSGTSEGRLIAVVITDSSFHFYMQHSEMDSAGNNLWSHKNAHGQPSNRCLCSDNVILTNSNIYEHAACGGSFEGGIVRFIYVERGLNDIEHDNGGGNSCVKTNID